MRIALTLAALALSTQTALAAQCGGSFSGFVQDMKSEAVAKGYKQGLVNEFFASVKQVIFQLNDLVQNYLTLSFLQSFQSR